MKEYPFIFSDRRKYRILRHAAFWTFWWLLQGFLYSFLWFKPPGNYWIYLFESVVESLIYLLGHMFLSYTLIYFVLPRYLLKQKYWQTTAWVIVLFLLAAALSVVLGATLVDYARRLIIPSLEMAPIHFNISWFCMSLMAGLRGSMTVAGFATTIKLMKYWYVKERKNLQLQKENAEAQLQLLKAQVHPHFLFNTLNNIYSFTQNTSPVASGLVMGLSDMLRYMLYECGAPLSSLDKELKMLRDYCLLEQVRYGNRLELHLDLPEDGSNLYIAPLLFLPFVENGFKHGASNMLDQPWISLHIELEDMVLKMKLVNGKPPQIPAGDEQASGIGILNVRQRLLLLYPGRHTLTITSEAEIFIVNMTVELERKIMPAQKPVYQPASEAYA